jgi:hypothetical protein
MIVCFGNCEVDLDRRELRVASNPVHVEPQVFDLLAELIDKRDRVVSKDEIILTSASPLPTSATASRTPSGVEQNVTCCHSPPKPCERSWPVAGRRSRGCRTASE